MTQDMHRAASLCLAILISLLPPLFKNYNSESGNDVWRSYTWERRSRFVLQMLTQPFIQTFFVWSTEVAYRGILLEVSGTSPAQLGMISLASSILFALEHTLSVHLTLVRQQFRLGLAAQVCTAFLLQRLWVSQGAWQAPVWWWVLTGSWFRGSFLNAYINENGGNAWWRNMTTLSGLVERTAVGLAWCALTLSFQSLVPGFILHFLEATLARGSYPVTENE